MESQRVEHNWAIEHISMHFLILCISSYAFKNIIWRMGRWQYQTVKGFHATKMVKNLCPRKFLQCQIFLLLKWNLAAWNISLFLWCLRNKWIVCVCVCTRGWVWGVKQNVRINTASRGLPGEAEDTIRMELLEWFTWRSLFQFVQWKKRIS